MAIEEATSNRRPIVSDPHNVHFAFVDWIIAGGVFENVLHLTLGTVDYSSRPVAGDTPQVTVASQLRMSRDFAMRLHAALGEMIKDSPPGTSGGPFN